jgi:hypothetical protein
MEQSPACETNSYSTSQEIPAFYGTQRFINVGRSEAMNNIS